MKRATKDQKALARKIYADKDTQAALFGGGKYGLDLELMKNRKVFSDKNAFGKAMNAVSSANFWALEFEDGINMERAFVKHLSMFMVARDLTTLKEGSAEYREAVKYATEQGMRACFREPSDIADALNRLEKTNAFTRIVVGGNIAFKKTPINLGKRAVEFSPAGIVKGFKTLNDRAKALKRDGETDITAGEVVNCFTEAATGTAIMGLGAVLAAKGILKSVAGDDDENKNVTAFQKMLGDQNFSLEILGYSIDISWSGPIGIALFTGAAVYQALNKNNDEDFDVLSMISVMGSMLDPMAEMSVLSGVVDIFSGNYNDGGKLIGSLVFKTLGNYVSQIVNPTLLRNIANTIDPTVRDTYVPKDSGLSKQLAQKLKYIANGIPFLSVKSQPKIDLWGNEVMRSESLPWRILQNFIIPGTINKIESSDVENELERLYKQTGETGILPMAPNANIVNNGVDYIMSEEEYTAYKKNYGQAIYAEYTKVIGSDEYRSADDKTKVEMLRLAEEYATEYGKNKYFSARGVQYDVSSWVKTVFNAENEISLEDAIVWKAKKNIYDKTKETDSLGESSDENKELLKLKEIGDKGFDILQYYEAESTVNGFHARKDKNGKSIAGSKKKAVADWLRKTDIDDKLKDYLWQELKYKGTWR